MKRVLDFNEALELARVQQGKGKRSKEVRHAWVWVGLDRDPISPPPTHTRTVPHSQPAAYTAARLPPLPALVQVSPFDGKQPCLTLDTISIPNHPSLPPGPPASHQLLHPPPLGGVHILPHPSAHGGHALGRAAQQAQHAAVAAGARSVVGATAGAGMPQQQQPHPPNPHGLLRKGSPPWLHAITDPAVRIYLSSLSNEQLAGLMTTYRSPRAISEMVGRMLQSPAVQGLMRAKMTAALGSSQQQHWQQRPAGQPPPLGWQPGAPGLLQGGVRRPAGTAGVPPMAGSAFFPAMGSVPSRAVGVPHARSRGEC